MLKIRFKVSGTVKIYNGIPDLIRDRCSGLTAFVAMKEESFAFLAVTGNHAVDMALCAAQCKDSTIFASVRMLYQCLDYFVLFQFIHCECYLSDNDVLLFTYIIEG